MTARPSFSVVTAVYNAEPYLSDFISSLERQRFDRDRIEVIAVDDGSTDASLRMLQDWARSTRLRVTVLSKDNGGQASARNLGLERATGEWVTFTDPDDMLDDAFFDVAARFARVHPDVEVLSSRPLILNELKGTLTNGHPRRSQYRGGNRAVNLHRNPNVFLGVSAGSLFRLDRIRRAQLRFDTRVWPNFEDGHFAARYVMSLREPLVGLLSDAKYIYRKRAAKDSTLQRSATHPGRYSDVLEHGYLDVIDRARDRYGKVVPWVQHLLIYELSWYLSDDDEIASRVRIPEEVVPTFHELLGRVLTALDPAVVRAHTARTLRPIWADILAYVRPNRVWRSNVAVRTRVDREMGLQRIAYRFTGPVPSEEFLVDGYRLEPAFAKTRAHVYYGRTLVNERIAWVPVGNSVTVRVAGKQLPIRNDWPAVGGPRGRSRRDRLLALAAMPSQQFTRALQRYGRRRAAQLIEYPVRWLARAYPFRKLFRDAWVLMDRIYDADDNAERLFEHLRVHRPDINAWFVVKDGTPDWDRLRRAGVSRLVAHGSWRWKILMLNCSWLLSSHADLAIAQPHQIMRLTGRATWKYAFLQHGVIKDDLSLWLNNRDIDLFVVSTEPELQSIVADGTGYDFTTKETRNTGLPRFDRLLEKGSRVPPEARDLVLVAPTWRTWLTLPLDPLSNWRDVSDAFWSSDYYRNWDAILRSPEVAEAAARHGRRVAFMPHPNIQPVLEQLDLPPHVEALSFAGNDVQALYARCALLVTDYSSVAFNLAYLDRPVVYFQFDVHEVMNGGHMGRRGYFDYERDGFGPVAEDRDSAIAAIVDAIAHGPCPTPEYQARIDRTFVARDGQACARVVAAVEELSRPYRKQ